MNRDHIDATLHDLDAELARHDAGVDAKLRKIACFCNTSLALHEGLSDSDRRDVNRLLHEVAKKHALPDDCVLPEPGHERDC